MSEQQISTGVLHAVAEVDIPAGGVVAVAVHVHEATCRVRHHGLPDAAGEVVFAALAAERLSAGDYVVATPDQRGAFVLTRRRNLTWHEIEELAAEDPDDRRIRLAHGFTGADDWRDRALLCRNGCGLPYDDVMSGKIRQCLGPEMNEGEA